MKNIDVYKLLAEGRLEIGTYIDRKKLAEINNIFLTNPELNEIFLNSIIREIPKVEKPVTDIRDIKANTTDDL